MSKDELNPAGRHMRDTTKTLVDNLIPLRPETTADLIDEAERAERHTLQNRATEAHKKLRNAAKRLLRHVEVTPDGNQTVPDFYLRNLQRALDKAQATTEELWEDIRKEKEKRRG